MKLTLTSDSFETRPGGDYFLGDLDIARSIVTEDRFVFEGLTPEGCYLVRLCDDEQGELEAEWGLSSAGNPEEAWRYALGAALGPYDYDEDSITLLSGESS